MSKYFKIVKDNNPSIRKRCEEVKERHMGMCLFKEIEIRISEEIMIKEYISNVTLLQRQQYLVLTKILNTNIKHVKIKEKC